MRSPRVDEAQVLIIGAGPAGLIAAAELAAPQRRRAAWSTAAPRGSDRPARDADQHIVDGAHAQVGPRARGAGRRAWTSSCAPGPVRRSLTRGEADPGRRTDARAGRRRSARPRPACVPQDDLEPVLARHARALGARVRRGTELRRDDAGARRGRGLLRDARRTPPGRPHPLPRSERTACAARCGALLGVPLRGPGADHRGDHRALPRAALAASLGERRHAHLLDRAPGGGRRARRRRARRSLDLRRSCPRARHLDVAQVRRGASWCGGSGSPPATPTLELRIDRVGTLHLHGEDRGPVQGRATCS